MLRSQAASATTAWMQHHSRRLKQIVIALGIAVALVQWVRLVVTPRGDFDLHWEIGRRLAVGEFVYERGTDRPYPPFWAFAHAPLTVFDVHTAQLLIYPLFPASLVLLVWVLSRLTRKHLPLSGDAVFWTAAVAIFLTSRFLVRDMMECGVNLALVALSWLAVYFWVHHRRWLGGAVLGLATALKCTPGLFIAYFVLKREWKMAATSAAAAAAFTLSPALWLGATEYQRAMDYWVTTVWSGISQPDPSMGVLGQEQLQNIALRPALARFLMHLPDDHKLRIDHPLDVTVLELSPKAAGLVVKLLMAGLLFGFAWQIRAVVRDRNDPTVTWECAGVSLLILLYSPITWGQHCVGVLPALYLITRTVAAGGRLSQWMKGILFTYVFFILVLNRELVGKEFTWLLDSYHTHTWCFLGLVAVALACRSRCRRSADGSDAQPGDQISPSSDSPPRAQVAA